MALNVTSLIVLIVIVGAVLFLLLRMRAPAQRASGWATPYAPWAAPEAAAPLYGTGGSALEMLGDPFVTDPELARVAYLDSASAAPAPAAIGAAPAGALALPPGGRAFSNFWPLLVIFALIAAFLVWLLGSAVSGTASGQSVSATSVFTPLPATHTSAAPSGTSSSSATSAVASSTASASAAAAPLVSATATFAGSTGVSASGVTGTGTGTGTLAVTLVNPVSGQQQIASTGLGVVSVPADQIELTLLLEVLAPSDLEARDSLNAVLSDLRTALQAAGVLGGDIAVTGLNFRAGYSSSLANMLGSSYEVAPVTAQLQQQSTQYATVASLQNPSFSNASSEPVYPSQYPSAPQTQAQTPAGSAYLYPSSAPYGAVSIPPASTIATAQVDVRASLLRASASQLLALAAAYAVRFDVSFTLSSIAQTQHQSSALLLARQNATDNALSHAQTRSLRLGGMLNESAVPESFLVVPARGNQSTYAACKPQVQVTACVRNVYAVF